MQQFTRALTREVQVAGERLALTFDKDGISIRPVGSRRPPHVLTWAEVLLACMHPGGGAHTPTEGQVGAALKALKSGGERTTRGGKSAEETPQPAAAPGQPPAQESSHSSDLHALLGRLDHWLADHRHRYHEGLLAPARPEDLSALEQNLGRPVSDDLRTWLTWHNGQNDQAFGALEENWHPMSATEIAEVKKELDGEGHPGWQRSWVPFLDDDAGNYLCLDTGQAGEPVRACWRGKANHEVVAPSLTDWVRRLVTGLEQGAYTEDPERGSMHRSA
jgi:cell wall assembly regulator SMI1